MSTKYTREQIDKARQRADAAFDEGKEDRKYHPGEQHPDETWIDTFTEALGLDVEPENPEPGTWHVVKDGDYEGYPARVFSRIELHIFSPMGSVIAITRPNEWPDLDPATPPARVVAATDIRAEHGPELINTPAEPVELSEEDLIRAYPDGVPYAYGGFINFPAADRSALLRMCQTLVAKHGIGRVEVSREQVRTAVDESVNNAAGFDERERITHAVMALMEASK